MRIDNRDPLRPLAGGDSLLPLRQRGGEGRGEVGNSASHVKRALRLRQWRHGVSASAWPLNAESRVPPDPPHPNPLHPEGWRGRRSRQSIVRSQIHEETDTPTLSPLKGG